MNVRNKDTTSVPVASNPEGEVAAKSSRDPSSCSVVLCSISDDGVEDDEDEGLYDDYDDEEGSHLLQNSFELEFAERSLPEDTFSFLIFSDVDSWGFVLGTLVFLFQVVIYIILLVSICEEGKVGNVFGFPETASRPLRIAQAMAILISIITQTDVRAAICLYRDGFDEAGLTQVFKGAKFWKWALSIGLRASEGLLGLFIAFLLIMTSDDEDGVVDLLLNFSAIEFVTNLDDVVFALVREGFLGREMKKEAKRMIMKTYFVKQDCANSKSAFRVAVVYFVVLFLSFFIGYGVIVGEQNKCSYCCNKISSQFEEEVLSVPSGKGIYTLHNTKDADCSTTYRSKDREALLFAYCSEERRWTLSINSTSATEWDPCKGWLAASSEGKSKSSSTYSSLIDSASLPWLIKNDKGVVDGVIAHWLECVDGKNLPTDAPSSNPSQSPSVSPTDAPSANPSFVTRNPTASNSPSSQPTPTPTLIPLQPTPRPLPTLTPTTTPLPTTHRPTTHQPTPQPARIRSTPQPQHAVPTSQPSAKNINTKTSKSSMFGDS